MLTEEQKELCIKAIAAIVWADGALNDKECVYFKNVILDLGYQNEKRADELLNTRNEFVFSDLQKLPRDIQLDLLRMAYHMANVASGVSESEKDVIKKIAAETLGVDKWDLMEEWLKSYSAYLIATKKFFEGGE